MKNNVIMLVEDNPDDEALTVRALKKEQNCERSGGRARRGRGVGLSVWRRHRMRAATPRNCHRWFCLI